MLVRTSIVDAAVRRVGVMVWALSALTTNAGRQL
jgi:hypothetical protein